MSLKPDTFDRDRPLSWNLMGTLWPGSKYGIGNEWELFAEDDGTLVCEQCELDSGMTGVTVMIVNDPFEPDTPVDFDTPVQVLCDNCVPE